MNTYTMKEVNKHTTKEDCWLVIDNMIYDITSFLSSHPGGSSIMVSVAGQDATEYFYELHRKDILNEVGKQYIIGELVRAKL